jgi:hypothetical protein
MRETLPENHAHSFDVSDFVAWGKLVKSWATGENRFDNSQPPPPLPRSIEELQEQCEGFGFKIAFAPWVQGLVVTQYGKETLFLRLPPKDLIERGETIVAERRSYHLPDFYRQIFGATSTPPDVPGRLAAHDARIGEYTINSCM